MRIKVVGQVLRVNLLASHLNYASRHHPTLVYSRLQIIEASLCPPMLWEQSFIQMFVVLNAASLTYCISQN